MTADEAKQALKEGKKVRPILWENDEYIKKIGYENCEIVFNEDLFEKYKDIEWEIVE